MHLARFPRVFLAHLSTPLEPMERLSKELGVEIWIKRDDCTGMSTGGNKTRKLEFLMAEALEKGADMVLIEVQIGAYMGEDDIVRYEDVYARN